MCYGMLCEYEDHMGNCTWRKGQPFPCPPQPDPIERKFLEVRYRLGELFLQCCRTLGIDKLVDRLNEFIKKFE